MDEKSQQKKDVEAYLARIRKTIADSERIVSQAELRIAETDRFLEQQGLTREQVMAMRFTDAQLEAANEELKRRGLDPIEEWGVGEMRAPVDSQNTGAGMAAAVSGDELENRQKKFGMMMKPFQI